MNSNFTNVPPQGFYGGDAETRASAGGDVEKEAIFKANRRTRVVRAWQRTYGLPTLVTNCSNNYGPYHFPEKLIPHMILNALAGKPLPVYGDGSQIRDWL